MKPHDSNWIAARPWLILACTALGLSALLAIMLVLSRAPGVQDYFGLKSQFHTILVLHVNFAVLVWLLSFVSFVWVLVSKELNKLVSQWAASLCALAALLMLLAPFWSESQPIMSNYVPVINSPLFFAGLLMFALGISLLAWKVFWLHSWNVIRFSALTWFVSLFVLVAHGVQLDRIETSQYFEKLFWGAGHVLQFVYILILWAVWKWPSTSMNRYYKFVAIGLLAVALGSLFFSVNETFSRMAYTALMQWGMFMLLIPMLWWLLKQSKSSVDISVRASALLLFLGLIIGLLIQDDTVIVTAHYHATNAAVTIAFMGLAYRVLNSIKPFRSVKLIVIQISLYTFGMVLYVLGMAGSGWLGVPRKTALIIDDSWERLSMGIMGLGGAISIIATLLFIVMIVRWFAGQQQLVKEFK